MTKYTDSPKQHFEVHQRRALVSLGQVCIPNPSSLSGILQAQ